jgi:gliding motility-associated-like protein
MKTLLTAILVFLFSLTNAQNPDTVQYNATNLSIYQVANTPGTVYTWTIANPGIIVSGQGTNTITVDWGLTNPGYTSNAVSVFVTNQSGCKSPISLLDIFIPMPLSSIFYPNAFTPNGDGVNDGWSPIPFNIVKIKWQVYNRWGELVYESNDINKKWNGQYKNEKQPIGNFVWICWWKGVDGKTGFDKGNLILIR